MPLVEHLYELRSRLFKAMLAITLGILVAFLLRTQIFDFLKQPYCDTTQVKKLVDQGQTRCTLYSFGPLEQFTVSLRVSFIAGILFSSPIWLYQIGAFITPALHKKEKRYAGAFLAFALSMFALGCAFAYLTMSKALNFLLGFAGENVTALPSIQSYLNFVVLILLAFGISFEFPVILMFLNVVGVLPSRKLRDWRRGMIVFIAVLSAVITPTTDPYTFTFMAVPLYVLYEVVIVVARIRERVTRKALAADPIHALDDEQASPTPLSPAPVEAPSSVD